MAALDTKGKERLKVVLRVAGNKRELIGAGIREALKELDPDARRACVGLRNLLWHEAKKAIERAKRNAPEPPQKKLPF